MSSEIYEKARRRALKDFRADSSQGVYPYLQVLDDILSYTDIVSEVNLGLVDIPLDQIVGTKTAGRTNSFSSSFMPLLPSASEFALKWSKLYDIHLREGIRDPIQAYEFMNRFYVIEGNKRVSILKYCDAVSIPGHVTRVIPARNDSDENKIYYEFLDFYKATEINYLCFSQPGNYIKITKLVGKQPGEVWSDSDRKNFRSCYNLFTDAFEKKGGKKLTLTSGDAFLIYLEIYGYFEFLDKSSLEIQRDISKIWNDFLLYPKKPEMKLIMDSGDTKEKKNLLTKILPQNTEVLKVAFIHDKNAEISSWVYGHELGRSHLSSVLKDQVQTTSYFNADTAEACEKCFEQAIAEKNTVIFTTSPKLLKPTLKYAMLYPKLYILNCSLNTGLGHLRTYYGRLYEAKFLTGAIAGVMSKSDNIGYVADYPIYGMIANINAFALGARMTNPDAKIYLEWSTTKNNSLKKDMTDIGISFISGQDLIKPRNPSRQFGLYDATTSKPWNLAMPVWNWGVFYEKIIKSILNGTWKNATPDSKTASINYWWGISSGMIDVICSSRLPSGTKRLITLLKQSISNGNFNPFSGTIYSQDGLVHNSDTDSLTPQDIITMDWLADNIVGEIPTMDNLVDDAKEVVSLQGVEKAKQNL